MTSRSAYVRLLADNGAFRRLWLADLVSLFGDWFNTIALYTAIDALLGSSQAVGWVVISKSLPMLLVSPVAGPLADRVSRRRLMIAADLVRALLGLLLIAAWQLGSVAGLYACTVLQISASGVFLPAKNAAIPSVVGGADVGVANALSGATWSVALAFGAAVGGVATQLLGIGVAFLLDSLTFVVSAWLLRALPPLVPEGAHSAAGRGFVAGVRYVATEPGMAPLVLLKSGMAWTTGAVPLLTVFGNRVLSEAPAPWIVGLLFAGRGAGAAIGSLFGRRVFGESRRQLERTALVGLFVLGLGYCGIGVAGSVAAGVAAAVVAGTGSALAFVSSSILIQKEVAPTYLGRAFSLDFGLMTVAGALGVVLVTTLVDAGSLTARGGMLFSGMLAVPPALGLWVWLAASRRAAQRARHFAASSGRPRNS